jgi:hypothetical protein
VGVNEDFIFLLLWLSRAMELARAAGIRDVRLGEMYTGVTLLVHDGDDRFTNMTGTFGWEELSCSDGGTCFAPTFLRVFPSGQKVTYGLHTPSQRMDILLHGQRFSPQELRHAARAEKVDMVAA